MRIANAPSTHGTFYPPRDETKPMGRPRLVTPELLEVYRFVSYQMSTEVQGGKGRGLCAYNVSHGMQKDDVSIFSERMKMKKVNNTNTHRYYAHTSKKIPLQPWENSHPSFLSNSASISADATFPITYMELATNLVSSLVAQHLWKSPTCLTDLPKTGSAW